MRTILDQLFSVPDIGAMVIKNGFSNTMGAFAFKLKPSKGFNPREIPMKELQSAGVAVEATLGGRAKSMADLSDPYMGYTKGERIAEFGSEVFTKATFLNQWNDTMKSVAGFTIQSNMVDAIRAVGKGAADEQITKLAASGIDKDSAKAMAKEIAKAKPDKYTSGVDSWENQELANMYKMALGKQVDATIVTAGIADSPLWMSSVWGRVLGQFQTHAFAVVNKTLIPTVQTHNVEALAGVSIMVSLGYLRYALGEWSNGRDPSTDPIRATTEAVSRSGVMGVYLDYGLKAAKMGGYETSRFSKQGKVGSLMGPTFSRLESMQGIAFDVGQGQANEYTEESAKRMIPFQGLHFLRKSYEENFKDE